MTLQQQENRRAIGEGAASHGRSLSTEMYWRLQEICIESEQCQTVRIANAQDTLPRREGSIAANHSELRVLPPYIIGRLGTDPRVQPHAA